MGALGNTVGLPARYVTVRSPNGDLIRAIRQEPERESVYKCGVAFEVWKLPADGRSDRLIGWVLYYPAGWVAVEAGQPEIAQGFYWVDAGEIINDWVTFKRTRTDTLRAMLRWLGPLYAGR